MVLAAGWAADREQELAGNFAQGAFSGPEFLLNMWGREARGSLSLLPTAGQYGMKVSV